MVLMRSRELLKILKRIRSNERKTLFKGISFEYKRSSSTSEKVRISSIFIRRVLTDTLHIFKVNSKGSLTPGYLKIDQCKPKIDLVIEFK